MKKLFLAVLVVFLFGCSTEKDKIKDAVAEEENVVDSLLTYQINRLDVVGKIEPSVTTGFYTYYEPKNSSNVMLDLVLEVQNTSTKDLAPNDYFSANFLIGDEKYETSIVTEEDGGTSLSEWEKIAPNKSSLVHIYKEISEDMITDEFICELTVNGKKNQIKLNRKVLAPKKSYINYGEIIEKENMLSVTMEESFTTKKLVPPTPNGAYSYYEVKDINDTYLVLKMKIVNNSNSSIELEKYINCKAIVDEKYEYTGFITWEEENGEDLTSYGDISPLKEPNGYYLILNTR